MAVTRRVRNTFHALFTEVENLNEAVVGDINAQLWGEWEKHLREYNRLGRQVREVAPEFSVAPVAAVRSSQRGSPSSPSLKEKAKLLEILQKVRVMLKVVKSVSTRCDRQRYGRMTRDQAIRVIDLICNGFHSVAKELARGDKSSPRFVITTERHLQQLLRGLLTIYFEIVGPEEPTPIFLGHSARIDFLIPRHSIAIETKMVRKGLLDRELGDQLIQDLPRYRQHQKCKVLYCFIYDPQGYTKNPRRLEKDLEAMSDKKLKVRAVVRPRGK